MSVQFILFIYELPLVVVRVLILFLFLFSSRRLFPICVVFFVVVIKLKYGSVFNQNVREYKYRERDEEMMK